MSHEVKSEESSRRGDPWAVASPHPAATEAAAAVLAEGGTAVDAAICAAGVLTVAYPHNCSIGGDLIGLVRQGARPPTAVYGVGRSAGGLDVESLRRSHGSTMPVSGPFPITVPGVVSGWIAMHELGGTLPFSRLLEPGAELAAGGVAVSPSVARALSELTTEDPGMAEVFGPPGARLKEGDLLVQPQLADTIAQVAKDPDGYYRGDLAARLAAGLAAAGSPLRVADLQSHRAVVAAASESAGGRLAPRVFRADLPSQGAFLGELVLALSELMEAGHDLTGRDGHRLARTFAAFSQLRDELLCDPARSVGHRAAADRFRDLRQSADARPGPVVPGRVVPGPGAPPSGDTVAVVVRDGSGRSVSMLQSIFYSFGSKVLDPETGVLFHNRGAMFSLEPGTPAELAPGLRPPHTLCPAMVDGGPGGSSLVLSTMGGRGQPQILAGVLLALASGKELSEAIAAPRIIVGDTDTLGSYRTVTAEADVPAPVLDSLVADGFDVDLVGRLDESTGHAQAVLVGANGSLRAASDPRCDGTAVCGP